MIRFKKNSFYHSDPFKETLAKCPDKVAIIFEDRKMTFRELEELSNKIANLLLASTSLKKGDSMALFLENCPEFIAVYLALSKIGVTAAFINCNLRGKSLAHCIRCGHCLGIFHTSELGNAVDAVLPELNPDLKGMLFSVGGETTIAGGMTLADEIVSASVEPPPPMSGKDSEGKLLTEKKSYSSSCPISLY